MSLIDATYQLLTVGAYSLGTHLTVSKFTDLANALTTYYNSL